MRLFISLLATHQLLLIKEHDCIENVALRKPAQQKSTLYNAYRYNYSSAWRAVDGRDRAYGELEEGCASTAHGSDKDAWWMVNLQRLYVIVNITVSGKADSFQRLRDFYIRVGNSSDIKEHTYCTYKSGWVELRVRETFRCNRTLVGSWVSIQRTNDKGYTDQGGQGWLQLCEVQVYGYEKGMSTTLIPWSPPTTFTVLTTIRHRTDVMNMYTDGQTPRTVSAIPWGNYKFVLITASISGAVVSVIFLTIIIALLIYIRRLKRGSRTNPTKIKGTLQVKNKQVSGNLNENISTEVPGMVEECESVGLPPVERHAYVNVEENIYETLDIQQITTPEPKTYARLGHTQEEKHRLAVTCHRY